MTTSSIGLWRRWGQALMRFGLGGFALTGFFCVSVIATGLGFADLRAANTDAAQLSLLELAFVGAVTLFVVSAMVAALNAALDDTRGVLMRATASLFYLFFAFWSVGFGFGFFWKELAGQEFTEAQFQGSISRAADSVGAATRALTTVEMSVSQVAALARERADLEAVEGGTCANRPASRSGDGPLTRSRFAFAERADALAQDVARNWTQTLAAQSALLERRVLALSTGVASADGVSVSEAEQLAQLSNAAQLAPAAREALFTSVFDELRRFTASANALRASGSETYAARLNDLASQVGADPQRPGRADPARSDDPSYCWDVVLSDRLSAAAGALQTLEDIPTPVFEFLEGPKATRAAFFNLARFAGGGWRSRSDTFGEKEFVALFASLAVDLGILILTLLRAPRRDRRELTVRAREFAETGRATAEQIIGVPASQMRALLNRYIVQDGGVRYLVVPIAHPDSNCRREANALGDLALFQKDLGGMVQERRSTPSLLPSRQKRLGDQVGADYGVRLYRLTAEAEVALKLLFRSDDAGDAGRPPPPTPMRLGGLAD